LPHPIDYPALIIVTHNDLPPPIAHKQQFNESACCRTIPGASIAYWRQLLGSYKYRLWKMLGFDAVFVLEEFAPDSMRSEDSNYTEIQDIDEFGCLLTNSYWNTRSGILKRNVVQSLYLTDTEV